MRCFLAGAGRAFLPAGLTGVPRSSQPAIAAEQAFLALKRFLTIVPNCRLCPGQEIQGVRQRYERGWGQSLLMSEKALRTALVRPVVLIWL